MDGVVYYGRFVRGQMGLGGSPSPPPRHLVGPNEIVDDRGPAAAAGRPRHRPGNQVAVLPQPAWRASPCRAGCAQQKLSAVVQSVSAVPASGTNFDAQLRFSADGHSGAIVPAMTCEVRLIPYKKANALCVPLRPFSPRTRSAQQFVYRLGKDGKPHKRPSPSASGEKQAEILRAWPGTACYWRSRRTTIFSYGTPGQVPSLE